MAKNENSNFSYITRRIGGTIYKIKVVFSDSEQETMEDKILRMIRNDLNIGWRGKYHTSSFSDNCSSVDSICSIDGRELFISLGMSLDNSY